MTPISINRPVTLMKLATTLGAAPFRVVHHFMEEGHFVTFATVLDDGLAHALAKKMDFDLEIRDKNDGDSSDGSPSAPDLPTKPVPTFPSADPSENKKPIRLSDFRRKRDK